MKTLKVKLKITKIERLKNSYYGNPRYRIYGYDKEYSRFEGQTGRDYSVGYKVWYGLEGKEVEVEYHETPAGNVIINDITE